MQITLSLLHSDHPLALIVNYLCPASPILVRACTSLAQSGRAAHTQFSRLRVKILRRDRFRCRGCDKKGDEITLSFYCLDANAPQQERALTLCVKCHEIATKAQLTGRSLPDFLRNLWRHQLPEQNGPGKPHNEWTGASLSQTATTKHPLRRSLDIPVCVGEPLEGSRPAARSLLVRY